MTDRLMVSVSGIRGVWGTTLTVAVVRRYVRAFAHLMGPGRIVIGSDTRRSREEVKACAIEALLDEGMGVVDLGIVPTPTVLLARADRGAVGGVIVTASHNPPEWNGLKFVGPSGTFLDEEEGVMLQACLDRDPGEATRGSLTYWDHAAEKHIARILEAVDPEPIRKAAFRVALDAVNGAGMMLHPHLLRTLGAEVIPIHTGLRDEFERPPEPLAENLGALREVVREGKCAVGFALDPDADRLALVDETGKAIGEEYTQALAAWHILERNRGPFVTNLSSSARMEWVARDRGVPLHRAKVGEVNVVKKMKEVGAVVGGEGNGGVIWPRTCFGRDSATGIAVLLHLMARTGRPLTALASMLPDYPIAKLRLPIPPDRVAKALEALAARYEGAPMNREDGLRIQPGGDTGVPWIHVRPSNTEPIVRAIIEARDPAELARVSADVRAVLGPFG